jgi:hypothetical protein
VKSDVIAEKNKSKAKLCFIQVIHIDLYLETLTLCFHLLEISGSRIDYTDKGCYKVSVLGKNAHIGEVQIRTWTSFTKLLESESRIFFLASQMKYLLVNFVSKIYILRPIRQTFLTNYKYTAFDYFFFSFPFTLLD